MHFPDQYFVGIRSSGGVGDKFNLGFPTPEGKDSPAKKRKQTVEDWTGKNGTYKTIDNVPVDGFKFVGDIKRCGGWFSNGNVVWRVEDPRGFEFEITSPNLAMLIGLTKIKNGVIEGKCLYARDGAKNALILENSEEYQATMAQTNRIKSSEKMSLKNLKNGDLVVMVDGTEAYYYGKVYCLVEVKQFWRNNKEDHIKAGFLIKERYLLISPDGVIDMPSTPKIASLKKTNAGPSLSDAINQVNKERPGISIAESYSSQVVYASKEKISEKDFTISPVQIINNVFEIVDGTVLNRSYSAKGSLLEEHQKIKMIKKRDTYNKDFIVAEIDGQLLRPNYLYEGYVFHCSSSSKNIITINIRRDGCDTIGFNKISIDGLSLEYIANSTVLENKTLHNYFIPGREMKMQKDPELFFTELVDKLKNARFFKYQLEFKGTLIPYSVFSSIR